MRKVVDPHLLAYNDTWDKVDGLMADCMSAGFRDRMLDSQGYGWVYNWFCVDHVDYDVNPRRRDIGYHNVFDHYLGLARDLAAPRDGVHFHYHPHNFRREAHRCATHWWTSSDSLQQILCRRVIDRQWFPAAHRPGFHVIRPDSHWFLEQFIPFDFSSQATTPTEEDRAQSGLEDGRWGDWRRAPATWEPYHPAHDDYQTRGDCRRWIARCLNVGTRYRLLGEPDVRQAFLEAREGKPVILAFTDHDFRDIRPDVEGVRGLLAGVGREFPSVSVKFCEAIDAMREALGLALEPACDLEASLHHWAARPTLSRSGRPSPRSAPNPGSRSRPWPAAITTTTSISTSRFTNGAMSLTRRHFPLQALSAIGVAANNSGGITTVLNLDPATGRSTRRVLNSPSVAATDPSPKK